MNAQQIRKEFLRYFTMHDHKVMPSSSLIPDNDPSVLLTTAGMQQFKPYYLGEKDPQKELGTKRVATVQKSFRTSDIEKVGDESHLTFFEMLGNFSFADYGKPETIEWAWKFLVKVVKLPKDRLWTTVFAGDDEVPGDTVAAKEWQKYLPKERIITLGRADNFWGPVGPTGPCGPCSEVHWQVDPKQGGQPGSDNPNFIEIWNLVFTEYSQQKDRKLKKLPHLNIDTGLGLERLAMITQHQPSVFGTDAFKSLLHVVKELPGFKMTGEQTIDIRRQRIVADHFKAACFLIGDGVTFSNKEQGYILRRVVRRAADQFIQPSFDFQPLVKEITGLYGGIYPELVSREKMIIHALDQELLQYRKLMQIDVQAVVRKMRKSDKPEVMSPEASHTVITPTEAFTLYSTHGLSLDRLQRLGFEFDRSAVEEKIKKHQEMSRAGAAKKFGGHGLDDPDLTTKYTPEQIQIMTRLHTATHLLHASLRKILGEGIKQSGSDINLDRLRFDFSFDRKLSDSEKQQVEKMVNDVVKQDLPVSLVTMPYQQAIDEGALAFFKEKYGAEVKVYSVGNFSKELCAGPHVEHSGRVGKFKITGAQSVGAGERGCGG